MSEDLGGFRERIAPRAFAKTSRRRRARLWNHDPRNTCSAATKRHLRLSEDKPPLRSRRPETQLIRDMVLAPIARGDVNNAASASAPSATNGPRSTANGTHPARVELFDVSPSPIPPTRKPTSPCATSAPRRAHDIPPRRPSTRSPCNFAAWGSHSSTESTAFNTGRPGQPRRPFLSRHSAKAGGGGCLTVFNAAGFIQENLHVSETESPARTARQTRP